MPKLFPSNLVDKLIVYFHKEGYSYREIQEIFNEVRGFTGPSLGYITKVVNKKKK